MDSPPTPRHPSLTPTSSALWLCVSTTLSNPFFKSPRTLSPTAPSLLYLPSTELPMKPHNGHRKLLQYLLDASSVNLSPPALPVPDTTAEASSDSLPLGSLKLSGCPPTNLKTVMIVVTLVVIFFLFSIFSIYVRRFANRRHPDNTPPSERPSSSAVEASASPTKGVDRTIVGLLPVYVYRCDAEYQVDCAICLSEYEEEERVKMIPSCQHVFHPECIDTWLFSHVSCPVCRSTRFFEENGSVGGGGSGEDCQTASETGGGPTVGNGDTWREEN